MNAELQALKESLDGRISGPDWRLPDLRHIMIHVITETACHTGHLDAVNPAGTGNVPAHDAEARPNFGLAVSLTSFFSIASLDIAAARIARVRT